MLATTLFVILIAMLMTTTLVAMNRQSLLFTTGANDRLAALEMAQSGLNRVIDRWRENPSFETNLKYEDEDRRRGYDIKFSDKSSVNNLLGSGEKDGTPARCARVVVTGYSGSVTKRIRCTLSRSLFPVSEPVNAAEHSITMLGELTLNGVKNPRDPVGVRPVKTGLHTNLPGTSAEEAMKIGALGGTVKVEEGSFLSAVSPLTPQKDFDVNVRFQLEDQPDALQPDANRVQLAENDIAAAMERAEAEAAPLPTPASVTDPVLIKSDVIIGKAGEVTKLGPVSLLNDATIFVRGTLVTPMVRGRGSVVAVGDVNVTKGQRMLMGNSGVSMVAGGNIAFRSGPPPNIEVLRTGIPMAARNSVSSISTDLTQSDLGIAQAESIAARVNSVAQSIPPGNDALVAAFTDLEETLNLFSQATGPRSDWPEQVQMLIDEKEDPNEALQNFVVANKLDNLVRASFGRGHFQGLAFAKKDLSVGGRFRIVGGVEAGESMRLGVDDPDDPLDGSNEVELTYCQAYRNLCPAGLGSAYLVSYQEE